MSNTIEVILVDDHPMFREGVARTLGHESDFKIIGQGASSDEAVQLANDLLPDIAILDIRMPGGGIEAARKIAVACPTVKTVMLTASKNEDDVVAALQAGARSYILKGVGGAELVEIVRAVNSGKSYVSPDLAARVLVDSQRTDAGTGHDGDVLSELTAREEQILKLVSRGLSNREAGCKLGLREKTVKHYMSAVLQKLQVRNRVEAALMARERFATL